MDSAEVGPVASVYDVGLPIVVVSVEADASAALYRLVDDRECIMGIGLL